MILLKSCTQYASKFGKLRSGHRTGKVQFSFQPKEGQCQRILKLYIVQLFSFRILVNQSYGFLVVMYGCESGTIKKTEHKRIMLLNCGDSWESLRLKGDQNNQSWRKSTLNMHWKDWCWSSNILATWCEEQTHWKRLNAGKDWRQNEKGAAEDEMFSYHQKLSGLEFEQTPEDNERQWSWCATFHGVSKSWTWLSDWITTKMIQEEGRGRN